MKMFTHLKDFNWIWVCGPQRSGTRIGSKIIAHDTGHEWVQERDFNTDGLSSIYNLRIQKKLGERCVIQCPGLTRWIHRVCDPGDAVVMMFRPIKDIIASQNRIDWQFDKIEAMKYDQESGSARLKYHFWTNGQKLAVEKAASSFEVYYNSLSSHRLFVQKEHRAGWEHDRTEVEK